MSDTEQKSFQKRQIAFKVRISDLLNGFFEKDEASAGFIRLGNFNVSRVNIISALVYKSGQDQNFPSGIIDDGTGKILLRAFENGNLFSKVDVGDLVLVIGRIREYNGERYIIPEIIRKLDNQLWTAVRKLEIEIIGYPQQSKQANEPQKVPVQAVSGSYDVLYSLIKKLDNGEGVAIDEVIKDSKTEDAEHIINRLLENGDIFEIKPGRIKVLE